MDPQKIFAANELQEKAVIRKFRMTAGDDEQFVAKMFCFQGQLSTPMKIFRFPPVSDFWF